MMADKKPETKPPAKPAAAAPAASPEAEATARINDLQARLATLKQEVRTIQGRLANRDPLLIQVLTRENEQLKARLQKLKKALYAIVIDSFKPAQADDGEARYEVLRRAAVEYFKKTNVAPEIWKNIES